MGVVVSYWETSAALTSQEVLLQRTLSGAYLWNSHSPFKTSSVFHCSVIETFWFQWETMEKRRRGKHLFHRI